MKNKYVLLQAEEQEFDQDSSDEGINVNTHAIPSGYDLPTSTSSFRLDRLIQHLEEAIHLHSISKNGSDHVLPTVVPPSSTHRVSFIAIGETGQHHTAFMPPFMTISHTSLSEPQRLESIPPLAVAQMSPSQIAWKDLQTTDLTSSCGLEGPRATDGTINEGSNADVGLTNEQRLLKLWMKKYSLRPAFPSALPGGIYLQARSMLPQNTDLASYLLTVPGLLYPKAPQVIFPVSRPAHSIPTSSARPDLLLPVHSPIEDIASIEQILREPFHLDEYPPHIWIKCRCGLYKDDVGLVVADDFEDVDVDVERLVLFPPRIPWTGTSDSSRSLKRKRETRRPDILSRQAGDHVARNHCLLDRRIVEGLQSGMKMLVATSTHPDHDRQVFLQTVDRFTGVYTLLKTSQRARKGVTVKVNPSTILENPRSFSVPANPAVARGLFMISVKLIRKLGKSSQFDELLDTETGCLWVEGRDLVDIYETHAIVNEEEEEDSEDKPRIEEVEDEGDKHREKERGRKENIM
ncbi:hypothetical protein F5878DRAFT_647560 [Lentinula raphanica]|uniref:Uncharacterized protein n=1 Tax=Lentinula raphanica TaxID=153919 RepID=A0AA38NVW5_9AGAR|nr:hypothetical protein F5878DRAFT_647560 [Lentinula raphanica]